MEIFNKPTRNIQTTTGALRDEFPGNALNSGLWEYPVITGAATAVVTGSNLVLALTTGATDSVTITGKVPFTIPCRASMSLRLSARSANQEVYFELVSKAWIASNGAVGSYARLKFDGITATNLKSSCRHVDAVGTEALRTIATTAAVTRIYAIDLGYGDVRIIQMDVDSIAARGAVFVHTAKVPPADEEYYLRITAKNIGASTALTATIDFVALQDTTEVMAEIVGGTGYIPASHAMPVAVVSAPVIAGQAAHDAAASGSPIRVAHKAMTAVTPVSATNDTADSPATMLGYPIVRLDTIPENEWSYAAAAGGIIVATDVVVKAAAAAGLRNYIRSIELKNANDVATEFVIKDGATVIWRGHLSPSMVYAEVIEFNPPLKTTAVTALNVACITTAAQVYCNCRGYVAP